VQFIHLNQQKISLCGSGNNPTGSVVSKMHRKFFVMIMWELATAINAGAITTVALLAVSD